MRSALLGMAFSIMLPLSATAQNLITNGNFEAGNTGFTSTYRFTSPQAAFNNDYTLSSSSTVAFPAGFNAATVNAFGSLALFADGSTGGNPVYSTIVNGLTANTSYTFSFFAANVNNDGVNPGVFEASFGGSVIGIFSPGANRAFSQASYTFNSGLLTSATLSIRDLTTTSGGNDFALDNISLVQAGGVGTPVPGPAVGAGLLPLLGLAAARLLRRRRERLAA